MTRIASAIENAGSLHQQILALNKAINLRHLGVVAISAGFNSNSALLEYQCRNVIKILGEARNTKGRTDNIHCQFIDSLLMTLSATPDDSYKYSLIREQANLLVLINPLVFGF